MSTLKCVLIAMICVAQMALAGGFDLDMSRCHVIGSPHLFIRLPDGLFPKQLIVTTESCDKECSLAEVVVDAGNQAGQRSQNKMYSMTADAELVDLRVSNLNIECPNCTFLFVACLSDAFDRYPDAEIHATISIDQFCDDFFTFGLFKLLAWTQEALARMHANLTVTLLFRGEVALKIIHAGSACVPMGYEAGAADEKVSADSPQSA